MTQPTMRRKISAQQLDKEPYLLWNEYVDLLAMSDYSLLTQSQRTAYLAFWYDAEVQNGGHLQYFENQGIGYLDETITALASLGAVCQRDVLSRARVKYELTLRPKNQSVTSYIEVALQDEFGEFDQMYHSCHPGIMEFLKLYLEANESEFIERT